MVVSKPRRKMGRVAISEELLLTWLKYEGGRLRAAEVRSGSGITLELVIEHDDMPVVKPEKEIPYVTPEYRIKPETYERVKTGAINE